MILERIRFIALTEVDFPVITARPSDPYILKAADGLGSPDMEVFVSSTSEMGGIFQGRRPASREMVFRVGLNPNVGADQTASELRDTLYGLLSPNPTGVITVRFIDMNGTIRETPGYVKRIEAVPFTKDPEAQIVVVSPQSHLTSPGVRTFIPNTNPWVIPYEGNAPAGFDMEFTFTGTAPDFQISQGPSFGGGNPVFTVLYPFALGDRVRIGTHPGNRYLYRVPGNGGAEVNLINEITGDSTWLMLHYGDNHFQINRPAINWDFIDYKPRYWGI